MQNYLDIDAKTGGAFDPDVVRILIDAFDGAWQSLEKSGVTYATDGHATETRDRLAKRIIELAREGERNQRVLRDAALLYLAQEDLRNAPPSEHCDYRVATEIGMPPLGHSSFYLESSVASSSSATADKVFIRNVSLCPSCA